MTARLLSPEELLVSHLLPTPIPLSCDRPMATDDRLVNASSAHLSNGPAGVDAMVV